MRQSNPNSCVIWYDAVTVEGKLDWQNELNEKNKIFFENCDAIFLNYTWKAENLDNSVKNSEDSEKKDRKFDVFVGVDVFGRGCMGGGGFECRLPMQVIREKVSQRFLSKKGFSSSAGNHNFSKIILDYKYAAFGFMNLCQK